MLADGSGNEYEDYLSSIAFLKQTSLFLRIQTSVGWEVLDDLFTRCFDHRRD
ncbi:hypothetical protein SORDD21_01622 [Streptococcus oralis]|uniref:Uncharacterized protein n=1 Tax=Streptococcus oralis TaxID=1303 RepID=A0A139PI21_STROR|nr:hypothetical protein SORDD21_01622 [Streptococcus oralis]